jgi:hypothetical protein
VTRFSFDAEWKEGERLNLEILIEAGEPCFTVDLT